MFLFESVNPIESFMLSVNVLMLSIIFFVSRFDFS